MQPSAAFLKFRVNDRRFFGSYLMRWAAGLALLWLLTSSSSSGEPRISREYQVKAAFLYNFSKFVEWPAQAFADPSKPAVIGVWAKNPFGDELQEIAKNHTINGRAIEIKEIQNVEEAAKVSIIFVTASGDGSVKQLLAALKGLPVLTVGESEKFAAAGGMVTFLREADKVRFRINVPFAHEAGLKISAQLLKLAQPLSGTN